MLDQRDQYLPLLEGHVLERPFLLAPEEGQGVADEGGVEVREAFEVELEAGSRSTGGAIEGGFGLLFEEFVGLVGGLGEAEEGFADAGVVVTLELRQEFEAETVASAVGGLVRLVVAEFLAESR